MDLPRQVIESIERRWAAKLQREVHAWKKQRKPHRKAVIMPASQAARATTPTTGFPGHLKA